MRLWRFYSGNIFEEDEVDDAVDDVDDGEEEEEEEKGYGDDDV